MLESFISLAAHGTLSARPNKTPSPSIRSTIDGPPSRFQQAGSATRYTISSSPSRARMPAATCSAVIFSPTLGLLAPYHSL